jgi:DNA-binding CsgD family transcriptional regulator
MMEISYSGIKFHNKNICRKPGAANRNVAVRRAIMPGITDGGPLEL